jgi:rare lipoprotein A
MKLSIVKRNGKQFFNVHVHHKPVFKNWINLNRLAFWVVTYIVFVSTSIIVSKKFESTCTVEPIQQVEIKAIPVPTVTPKPVQSWTGKVSYYSHDGCLGCGINQVTASGEKFDEEAMTLAFNRLPMKTMVLVTNLDTGTSIVAKVNDRGGFEAHGRIADLSKGLFIALGAKTDISKIKIEKI